MSMTDDQIRGALDSGLPEDDLMIETVAALRAAGHTVDVQDADGVGPRTAYVVAEIDGRRMRLSAEPW